jgi:LSD1 subclass zinc finger protein
MALRRILCTQCDRPLEVDEGAKSVNCMHCNTRVVTEAMTVDAYVAVRRFTTANRMKITKKGLVYASVRADALEIEGFLQGDALSLTGIRLAKTARVTANLRAARLALEPGAVLSGDLRIGPDQVPETQALIAPIPPRV